MKSSAARLPPLDPDVVDTADAESERREQYLRKALAEGNLSPSRRRMMQAELRLLAWPASQTIDRPAGTEAVTRILSQRWGRV